MPLYDIEHTLPLSTSQKDALAEAITVHHTQMFTAPRLFVNVRFIDISSRSGEGEVLYVAGRRRTCNRVIANVRHGPSRTQEMYDELCAKITKSWDEVIGNSTAGSQSNGASSEDKELRAIFILGSIVAGAEVGFPLPQAGKDQEWMKKYMSAFEEKANSGDQDFVDLVKEIRERKEFGMN